MASRGVSWRLAGVNFALGAASEKPEGYGCGGGEEKAGTPPQREDFRGDRGGSTLREERARFDDVDRDPLVFEGAPHVMT